MPLYSTTPPNGALGRSRDFQEWAQWCVGCLVDARSHRVICLVAGIWLINAFDLVLTILAHDQGLLHEQNPVARGVLATGTVPLILYKIGLVFIGSYPLLKYRTARITELGALVVLLIYATLAVRWSVCTEVYHASMSVPVHTAGAPAYPIEPM